MTKRNVLNGTWEPISGEESALIEKYKSGKITMQELREQYPKDVLRAWRNHFKPSGFSRRLKKKK